MTPKQARLNNLSKCLVCGRYGHPKKIMQFCEYISAKKDIEDGKMDSYPGGLCHKCRVHTVEVGCVAYELRMKKIPKGSPEAKRVFKQFYRSMFRYTRKHKKSMERDVRRGDY